MDNKYKDLFQSLSFQKQFRPAIHIGHISIDDYASELLSGIFERDIYAEGKRSDFYDWNIKISNDFITEIELEKLYDIVGASEHDRKCQSDIDEDDDVSELCQRISNRLFSKIMPFEVEVSFSDEEGIWLLGGLTDNSILESMQINTGDNEESQEPTGKCCSCGNNRFTASQVCYHDIIVDSDNNFIEEIGIGQAEKPYGAYRCTKCDIEYEELEDIENGK